MNKKRALKMVCIILLFLVAGMLLFPWLRIGKDWYTLFVFYRSVFFEDQLREFVKITASAYFIPVFLVFGLVAGIGAGVKAVLMLFHRSCRIVTGLIYGAELVYIATMFSFGGYMPSPAALLSSLLIFTEFMVEKYAQEYEDFTKEWEFQRKKEAAEKAERKKRLSFPGKYDVQLLRIMWRETRHQKRALFLICAGNSALLGIMLFLFAMKTTLGKGYGITDELPSQGLNGILSDAVFMVVLIYLFYQAITIFYYIDRLRERQRTLWVLGAREKAKMMIQGLEYGLMVLCSLLVGTGIGTGVYGGTAVILNEQFHWKLPSGIPLEIYFLVMLFFLLMSGSAIFVTNDSLKGAGKRNVKWIPGRRMSAFLGLLAVTGLIYSVISYGQRRNAESIYSLLIGIAGSNVLFIVAFYCWKRNVYKDRSETFSQIMEKIPLQSGFLKNIGAKAALFFVHFVFLAVLSIKMAGVLAAPPAEKLYPYDYVCIAYPEDTPLFEELKKNQLAEVLNFPMTRVTTVQGEATDWIDVANNYYMSVIWPQGQHIGISQTTYQKLCREIKVAPKEFSLEKEQIHIVYQQDLSVKAHPLDWFMDRKKPYIRIGQPLRYYDYHFREQEYPPRQVKSEERAILTGVFQGGFQENLVVFSDSYFNSIRREEGPSELVLLRVKEEARKQVEEKLSVFAENHKSDSSWSRLIQPYYSKNTKVDDVESERILIMAALFMETVMLLMSLFLIQTIKLEFEKEERKKRRTLLFHLGIRRSEEIKNCRKEYRRQFFDPLIHAYILASLIAVLTCYLRDMSRSEGQRFVLILILIWGIYLAVYLLVYRTKRRESIWKSN